MQQKEAQDGIISPASRQTLLVFSMPKTPKQAQIELSVKEVRCWEFLRKGLLKCLNPESKRGRFYILSDKARECLKIPCPHFILDNDWEVIGWLASSPRQRLVILRCTDERKLTSEEIRMRATQLNCHLSRTSTKTILKSLIGRHLITTEILERIRFYWINAYGKKIKDELAVIAPLAPAISGFSAA